MTHEFDPARDVREPDRLSSTTGANRMRGEVHTDAARSNRDSRTTRGDGRRSETADDKGAEVGAARSLDSQVSRLCGEAMECLRFMALILLGVGRGPRSVRGQSSIRPDGGSSRHGARWRTAGRRRLVSIPTVDLSAYGSERVGGRIPLRAIDHPSDPLPAYNEPARAIVGNRMGVFARSLGRMVRIGMLETIVIVIAMLALLVLLLPAR